MPPPPASVTGNTLVYSEKDLPAVVEKLAPIIPLIGSEQFVFRSKRVSADTVVYDMHQTINGLYVLGRNLRIFFDRNTNQVVDILSSAAPDKGYSSKHRLSQDQAIAKAINGSSHLNIKDDNAIETDSTLVYQWQGNGHDIELGLYWAVSIMVDGHALDIMLVAEDGTVRSTRQVVPLKAEVCSESNAMQGMHCTSPTINPDGTCNVSPSSICSQPNVRDPYDTTLANGAMWDDLLSSGCCEIGVGGEQTIIYDSDFAVRFPDSSGGEPAFVVSSVGAPGSGIGIRIPVETIVINKNSSIGSSEEAISHELGHALHYHLARDAFLTDNSATPEVQFEHHSVREGIADINAIIFENYQQSPPFNFPNWEIVGRVLSEQATYPNDMEWPNGSLHDSGRILGHAFYELVSNNNGVDFRTAATLFYRSLEVLSDLDSNLGISFDEVRAAMVRVGNASQDAAINEAFADAGVAPVSDGSSGGGSGGSNNGALSAPGNVSGYLINSCTENFTTTYNINWSSVSGATFYHVYYFWNGTYTYAGSTTQTSQSIYTRINTHAKIQACNANGCSAISSDSFTTHYLCQ